MQATIEDKGGLKRQVNITIPAEKIDAMLNEKYEQLGKTLKVDGFRPGHVPMKVVKERHGEQVRAEAAQKIVQDSLSQAIVDNELQVAGQPHVHASDVEEGKDYEFHAHVEVFPTVEPKGIDKVKLTKENAEPNDEMVQEILGQLQKNMQSFAEKEGAAAEGDQVTVTGDGFVKGEEEPFPGGQLTDFAVVIGSGALIPGFEEGLKGLKAGDNKDVDVTFPAEYHAAELAGKDAVFKLTINKVEAPEETKLDDAMAQKTGHATVAELTEKVKESLTNDLLAASRQRMKRQLLDTLDEENTFDVPANLVEAESKSLWQAQMQEWQQQGMNPADVNEEELKTEFEAIATRRVKLGILLAEIAKANDLDVTPQDLKEEVEKRAQQAGPQADQLRQYYSNPQFLQQLAGPILEDKVMDWLMSNADITEKSVEADDLMKEFR